MTPEQFDERIAYEMVSAEQQQPETQPDMIAGDDPDFMNKFLGQ